ncbi:S8 family serine peptidase [Saprospira grandis]|uniref:Protease n=1 Tax=Saprospira grandis (strain Lewin) TaxID=984262 RepID=H6L1H5_SAPGL|nr:S8 family serine peptidase [Saprospira grandis]AFC24619.1 protease [Saprospira grandis str. Lewin]
MSWIGLIFIWTFASLSLWLLFKEEAHIRKYFGPSFIASFLIFLAYHLVLPSTFGYIRLVVYLFILFGGAFVLNIFSNNKIAFLSLLGASVFGLYQLDVQGLNLFFGQKATAENLDPQSELLIELEEGQTPKLLDKLAAKYGFSYEPAFKLQNPEQTDLDDFYALNIPESALDQLTEIEEELKGLQGVESLEENEILQLWEPQSAAAISRSPKQPLLNDPGIAKMWAYEALNYNGLHRFLQEEGIRPKKKARIFILDTGVDAKHEDIKDQYRSVSSEYDKDVQGHGTHCAGIAAAVSNNGKGVASAFPSSDFVELSSIQVFPRSGGTTQRRIINAMLLAADKGADVVSMSLGGPSSDDRQKAYEEAVRYVNKKGGIVVVAAGNNGFDARRIVPASVNGVITVSALDPQLRKASFSNEVQHLNYGLAAPGVDIYSSMPNSKYDNMSGTSMATPYVAGTLGLLRALHPQLTTKEAYELLAKTGKQTADGQKTGPLIQPMQAVKALK